MLKNYSARPNAKTTPIEKIQQILMAHRARSVTFDYDDSGQVVGITFSFMVGSRQFGYKMPARIEKVEKILGKEPGDKQAYTTAWANIRDWIDAQLALVDTEMAKIEEVFLPYMVNGEGKTLFEVMQKTGFYLPTGEDIGK